jgi:hypothetical protein
MQCSVGGLIRLLISTALLLAGPTPVFACATCGCTLSADAAMGYSVVPGWHLTIEDDYINQDQLRGGTRPASASQVVNDASDPALGGGEIEKQTINHYLTMGLSYSPSSSWNLNLLVPYVVRDHTTYGVQLAPYTASETAADQISGAHVSGVGDVRLIGSYQGLLPVHNLGLQFGVKLPTGQYGTRVDFDSGPNAGKPLDASLQAGTGSTDLIFGAYYYHAVGQNFDAFVNGQFQSAVAHRQHEAGNDFRPGNSTTMSLGLRYEGSPQALPQLQLNVLHKSADQGALADSPDTAGTVVYVSPGVTLRAFRQIYLYGFVQLPVYSKLDGYQLIPHWTATVGANYAF